MTELSEIFGRWREAYSLQALSVSLESDGWVGDAIDARTDRYAKFGPAPTLAELLAAMEAGLVAGLPVIEFEVADG